MSSAYQDSVRARLWNNNPAWVQLLGLCPLLAASSSAVNALGLGLATLLVLAGSSLTISLLRKQMLPAIRLPVFVMIIAAFTTCAELLMQAYAYTLYQTLGIFVPLIATNCAILGRAESCASGNPALAATRAALMMSLGSIAALLVLGSLREVLGTGYLFANMERLLPFAANWKIQWYESATPFLLAILPPGAFLLMGLLIALKNVIDKCLAKPVANMEPVPPGSRRVRVTGQV